MKLKECFTEARLYFEKFNAEILTATSVVGMLGAVLNGGRVRIRKQPKITNNYLKRHHKPMRRRGGY